MQKPAKHWKNVLTVHRDSDSLNESMTSNRSSCSSSYKKFQFNRNQHSNQKGSKFKFTPRNKDNPYDVSLLTKRSDKQESSTISKPQTKTQKHLKYFQKILRKASNQEKEAPYQMKKVMIDVKYIMSQMKSTLEYFNRQLNQLKNDWQKTLKAISKMQFGVENSIINELKEQLEQKNKELNKLSKESFLFEQTVLMNGSDIKNQRRGAASFVDGPFPSLPISKVDMPRCDISPGISRNNTLNSLLNHDKSHRQLAVLRQRVQRMRETLQCQ